MNKSVTLSSNKVVFTAAHEQDITSESMLAVIQPLVQGYTPPRQLCNPPPQPLDERFILSSRYVCVPKLAHFGNHFLPHMVNCDMPILVWFQNWDKMHSLFYRVTHVPYLPTLVWFQNWRNVPYLLTLVWFQNWCKIHSLFYRVTHICQLWHKVHCIPMLVECDIPILD